MELLTYLPTVPHHAGHVCILLKVTQYAHIEEMSHIFKSPLKVFRAILYFHFYNDFIFRVFINIVFCQYSAWNEAFNIRMLHVFCSTQVCFKFNLHSSRWLTARNKKAWEHIIDRQKKIFQLDLIPKTNISFMTYFLLPPMSRS